MAYSFGARFACIAALGALLATGCKDGGTSSSNDGGGGSGEGGSGAAGGPDNGGGGEGAGIVDPVIPEDHPRLGYEAADIARWQEALENGTDSAAGFKAFVDSALQGGDPYDFQGWHAGFMYLLTGDEAYADLAIQFVDARVAEDEAQIANGEPPNVAYDSYLEVGHRVGDMALVFDWCFDRVTAEQRERWIAWGNQAVYNVWHHEEAEWGGVSMPWSGWSVDDPVNNYYFSFLRATMLLGVATYGENPEAPGFVEHFRDTKLGEQLVPAYAANLDGGGSREGTGYGVAMMNLFRLYYQWQSSTGERIADLTPHARESIAYMIHAIVPTLDRLAPIGDHARDSSASLFDYHRDYLLVLGALYPNDPATLAARTLLAESSVPEMSQGFMRFSDFMYDPTGLEAAELDTLNPTYHAQGTGHIYARSSWSQDATWMSFIAGAYDQSHAHHDQGSLMVYGGEWLAYDANVDSHSGIRQEEELHNLVRIEDGGGTVARMVEGAPEAQLMALSDSEDVAYFATDVTPVYGDSSVVESSLREVIYLKPNIFVIRDRIGASSGSARAVFQLNTPVQPSVSSGRASIDGSAGSLDLFIVSPSGITPSVVNWGATDEDMNGGYRIDAGATGSSVTFITVLSVDGAAVDADANGANALTIATANGSIEVAFATSGFGATVEMGGETTELEAGIQELPLLQ